MFEHDSFNLSQMEQRAGLAKLARGLGWLALFALAIVTAVHAISLVISQVGLESGVLAMIRIAGVALVEVLAILVAIQFASHSLQGQQKILGLAVEVVWLLFASLNLITSFAIESGSSLPTALAYWLHYGLPISALAAGALYYIMMRVDPEAQRMAELKATEESHRMAKFTAQKDVLLSPQMASVLKQRGWLDMVANLEKAGYSQEQIAFMMSGVPELRAITGGQSPDSLPAGQAQDRARAQEEQPALAPSPDGSGEPLPFRGQQQ